MRNRDTRATWAYHDGTKHSLDSIRRGPHSLDWDNMPLPFKIYTDLEPIPLPRELPESSRPALDVIADPGSGTESGPAIDLGMLARLLRFSAGVLRQRKYPGGEVYFRAAACTGALYHVDLYAVTADLPDLEAGVYHFGPHDFALRRLRRGDHRATLVRAAAAEPAVAAAPVILVCSSTFWRNAWKYRARAYRHCFWDSGTILGNLLAVAAATAVPARVVLGFVDAEVNRLLDLDVEREVALALVPLGRGAPAPPAPPEAPPLELRTQSLSRHEVDYPPIGDAHRASCLESEDEVRAWRTARGAGIARVAAEQPISLRPLADAPADPIEAVIRCRGSSRAFSHAAVSFEAFSTILGATSTPIPADFLENKGSLLQLYFIADAVEDLPPGAYVYDPAAEAVVRLRAGSFRREAAHLGLGQALPGDAAFDLFWLTDLNTVLDRFGNRGYRAAQLEAAIRGGKAYLASYALGIGATGLTFFDDDVSAFFGVPARSVMFLTAHGRPASAGKK